MIIYRNLTNIKVKKSNCCLRQAVMQCLQKDLTNSNSTIMETKLLCALVVVAVNLNVQVFQNKFLLGICKQANLLISVTFACFKGTTLSLSEFLLSITAARHVCFCVFIRLAVVFYTAFVSVARHRHDMSRFKSTSVEHSYGCGSN